MPIHDIETAIRHSRLVLEGAQQAFWNGPQDHDAKEYLSAAIALASERLQRIEDAIEQTACPDIRLLSDNNL